MTDWSVTHPRARKVHVCMMCHRAIDFGEVYKRGAGLDSGTVWTWKECAHCEALLDLYDIAWDTEYNEDSFDSWASEASWRDLVELRHAASYRMKWRTRSGALLPIPTREKIEA